MNTNRQYPAKEIICALMFSNGDSNSSLDECQDFVSSTVKSQLRMIVDKSRNLAKIRGRHPLLIKRMIAYVKRVEIIPVLVHAYESTLPKDTPIDDDFEQSSTSVVDLEDEYKGKLTKHVLDALKEMDVLGTLLNECWLPDNEWNDPAKVERMRRIADRVREMDGHLYDCFSEARQKSFCSKKGKDLPSLRKGFLKWIEAEDIEQGVSYLFQFCAIEIVTILVESALLCRTEEQQKKEKMLEGYSAEFNNINTPLRLCHYEEALKRNRGWALRGDILFGNF
uniref:Uncharacterized protein n=1 Tax=Meloidogyne hapla TaxID=6305 RepID=A0A1I8BYK4_MELHA